jgi:predicted ATP-binding protein involved in virulence
LIDEIDAHLHPSWQRAIVPVLRETFPQVQFITSAHSPFVIGECLESEVAVLRKVELQQRFVIETDPALIGENVQEVLRDVFETDSTTAHLVCISHS